MDPDMFRKMRRSTDPEQRAIGEAERMQWVSLRAQFGKWNEWIIENAPTEELRKAALEWKATVDRNCEP